MNTKTRRIIWIISGVVLLLLLGTGSLLYFQARRAPRDYTPVILSPSNQEEVRQTMTQRLSQFVSLAGELGSWDPRQRARPSGNGASAPAPATQPREGTFVISQAEVNQWTAAASQELAPALALQGISRPAVAFGPDRLTFYCRQEKLGAVVGVDLSLHFDEQDRMTVEVLGARIGQIPLPDSTVEQYKSQLIGRLREQVRRIASPAGRAGGADPVQFFAHTLAAIADALDGRPMLLDIRQHFGNVRIRHITLEDGRCTLELVPLTGPAR